LNYIDVFGFQALKSEERKKILLAVADALEKNQNMIRLMLLMLWQLDMTSL